MVQRYNNKIKIITIYNIIQTKEKCYKGLNKGNNKITELRTIFQRESQNS